MKKDLLLGIDVGNTNITYGIFQGKNILKTFRMTTKMQRTSDEFGVWITSLLGSGTVITSFSPSTFRETCIP